MSNDIIVLEEILGYVLEALDVIEVRYDGVNSTQISGVGAAQVPSQGNQIRVTIHHVENRTHYPGPSEKISIPAN